MGKTTLHREVAARGIKICDSDSSTFDKAEFPQNYIAHIKEKLADGYTVLCSTHKVVREALQAAELDYTLVYPAHALFDDYIRRYEERNNTPAFVTLMSVNWTAFVTQCAEDRGAAIKIELNRPDLHLADVITVEPSLLDVLIVKHAASIAKIDLSYTPEAADGA